MEFKKEIEVVSRLNNKIKLIKAQKVEEFNQVQNTKDDIIKSMKEINVFELDINGNRYKMTTTNNNIVNIYNGKESTDLKNEIFVNIKAQLDNKETKQIINKSEKYKKNLITGNGNLPDKLLGLIDELKSYGTIELNNEIEIKNKDNFDFVISFSKEAMQSQPIYEILKNNKINFNNVERLVKLSNKTKDKNYFLKKLDQFNDTVLFEMVYAMETSDKILENFAQKSENSLIRKKKNKTSLRM